MNKAIVVVTQFWNSSIYFWLETIIILIAWICGCNILKWDRKTDVNFPYVKFCVCWMDVLVIVSDLVECEVARFSMRFSTKSIFFWVDFPEGIELQRSWENESEWIYQVFIACPSLEGGKISSKRNPFKPNLVQMHFSTDTGNDLCHLRRESNLTFNCWLMNEEEEREKKNKWKSKYLIQLNEFANQNDKQNARNSLEIIKLIT